MSDEERLKEGALEMQLLDQQMRALQKQLASVELQLAELRSSIEGLDAFSKVEPGQDVLVPVVGGMFVASQIVEPKKLMVNVGAGTVVECSIDDAKVLLERQLAELSSYRERLLTGMLQLSSRAKALESELTRLLKEVEQKTHA